MFGPKNVLKSCFLTQKCPEMTVFYPKIRHFRKNTLYLSRDFGKTFKKLDVNKIFKTEKEKFYIRKSHGVITNNVNSKRVMLIEHPEIINTFGVSDDPKGSRIWLNTDVTDHEDEWSEVQLDFQLDGQLLEQHPHDEECMLAIGAAKDDNRALWITTDGGRKWKKIDDNVHRYRWDPVQNLESDKTKYGFYYRGVLQKCHENG